MDGSTAAADPVGVVVKSPSWNDSLGGGRTRASEGRAVTEIAGGSRVGEGECVRGGNNPTKYSSLESPRLCIPIGSVGWARRS